MPFLYIKRLFISLIEKYHPFNIRYFKFLVVLAITILSGIVLILGWMSAKKVREVVTEDFNQQQLALARHAAAQIENSIDTLKREIVLLSLSPTIQYAEPPYPEYRLNIAFSSVSDSGVREIRLLDKMTHKAYVVSDVKEYHSQELSEDDIAYLDWGRKEENRSHVYLTDVTTVISGQSKALLMKMILPVWQISSSHEHKVPTNNFSGVLIFSFDVNGLIKDLINEIRSGKTGYAWVLDENGIFVHHREESFIGENAFEVRKGKQPQISFHKINEIQKDKMLKGEEGTSWYISGWHGGIEGQIKKMIAYTPINLKDKYQHHLWSVAVVAPVSEIEGAIHSIHLQQFVLQALIIFIIIAGGLIINFMMLTWSNMLELEVARKTIELKKSEQRYKSLVENAEDIIFTADYKGSILSINDYGIRFFNLKAEKIIGHNISEIFSLPTAELLLLMIRKVFETKESREITQLAVIGERQYWFNTKLRRLWDEEGNIYAVLGISRDITAMKEKEKEEQRYNLEKLASMGTLAAGVAHEINNPLGIILGFSDILIEKARPDSEEHAHLKTIEKQALNAKKVVENLLRFARYSEHKEELLDVNSSIETILSVVKNTLFLNKISLEQSLQKDLPSIKADAGELEQVFLNIINNAIQAMNEGGTLTIQTMIQNSHVEIRLSDTGEGIAKEHRSRIFDPLFTTKKVGEGTGLGLSVSYGIITKYGGTITFETKTKNESDKTGTTFIITLPASTQV